MQKSVLDLYQKYYSERQFERLDLFGRIAEKFAIQRVLYAGSFVHITPSFVFPEVVYVDSDQQAKRFFNSPEVKPFIAQRKIYPQEARFSFHFADYHQGFDENPGSFDLLISQYAGFVGQQCKHYLKPGGLLLANNSHGDAGMAALDEDYELTAVCALRSGEHQISTEHLEQYFIPQNPVQNTRENLEKLQKGIGYQKTESAYLFRRIQ